MELFLDPTDGRPRSVQIYEQLRNAIVEGRLTAPDRLAPTRTVAAELGVSRSTVTEAYGRLSAEGYIEGRAGGGSVVGPRTADADPPPPTGGCTHPDAEGGRCQAVQSSARYSCHLRSPAGVGRSVVIPGRRLAAVHPTRPRRGPRAVRGSSRNTRTARCFGILGDPFPRRDRHCG